MNLLFILPEFYPSAGGGICTYYQELLKESLKNPLYKITIIQGSGVEARGGVRVWEGIRVYYLPLQLLSKYKGFFSHLGTDPELQSHIASSWAMYELAESLKQKFDAVITTDWGFGFIPWIIRQQTPVIVHLHGSVGQINFFDTPSGWEFWSAIYLQIESGLLSFANELVTHSVQNSKFWKQRLFSDQQISLVSPIIALRKKYSLEGSPNLNQSVGMVVGRIQNWKGPIQLCEAIKLLPKEKQNKLKIYWIGRDTIYSKTGYSTSNFLLKNYADIWGKKIEPVGEKNRDELEAFYQLSGWALVPSTWDMFNITAAEHLLHKKPLLCSKAAGVSDFLTPESALLFDNTPPDLANAIERAMDLDPFDLQLMAERGFRLATKEFYGEYIFQKHIEIVQRAINNFHVVENLEAKFEWLLPKENSDTLKNPKEVLLSKWPLKEVPNLFLQRLKEKIKSGIQN